MTLAEKLKSIRKQAGMSQEQLAEKLGVSRQAVTKWETDAGIPDIENCNFHFYNKLGFRTSSDFGIFPTSGYPMKEPRCMMCKELYPKALSGITGYVVYDMYCNA